MIVGGGSWGGRDVRMYDGRMFREGIKKNDSQKFNARDGRRGMVRYNTQYIWYNTIVLIHLLDLELDRTFYAVRRVGIVL